jgi:plastocyanin
MQYKRMGFVKKIVAVFAVALLMALLSGCVVQSTPSKPAGNTVKMGPNNFASGDSITIKKGDTITFVDDPATGTPHILVIGTNGSPEKEDGAPDFGANGISFSPGDSKASPTWDTPGTYHVTCTLHPTTMNLVVTVTG